MISLLRRPKILLFLLGATLSAIGGGVAQIALPLYVLRSTHSTVLLALVFVVRQVPITGFSLFLGHYIDDWGPRRSALIGLILGAVAIASLPFFAHVPVMILLSSFAVGLSFIFLYPIQSMYLPRLVSKDELHVANGLFSGVLVSAGLGGNALGGVVASLGWYHIAFWGGGALDIGAALTVVVIGNLGFTRSQEPHSRLPGFETIREVWRLLNLDRILLMMFVMDSARQFALGAQAVNLPKYVLAVSSAPLLYAVAVMASNLGELIGSFIAPSIFKRVGMSRLRNAYVVSAFVLAGLYILVALWVSIFSAVFIIFACSLLLGVTFVEYSAYNQQVVPAGLMGRFQSASASTTSAFRSAGNLAAGALSAPLGIGFLLSGIVILLSGFTVIGTRKQEGTVPKIEVES